MSQVRRRSGAAMVIGLAVAVGAMLPTLGDAAERVAATIGTAQLKNNAVTNAKVRPGSLLYTALKPGQVARGNLAGIRAGGVLSGTFPRPRLADGAVTGEALATASVSARAIAKNAVGRAELASGSIGSDELAPGAVRTSDIADGSIGAAKLAANSIRGTQIAAGAIGSSELARGAVGASELAALPGGRVYRSTSMALPSGSLVEVPLTDVDYAQGGAWSASQPTRLTAPVAGVYQVTASAVFQPNGTGSRGIWIAPAGAPDHPYVGEVQGASTQQGQHTEFVVSYVLHLEAGQGVSLVVRQTSGYELALVADGRRNALGLQFLSS